MIVIIDYGVGNLASIHNMLGRLCVYATITSDIKIIGQADKLIIPGVGSFDYGMKKLKSMDLFFAESRLQA